MSAGMANLALAPVLVPLMGAVGCVLLAARPRLAEAFSLLAGVANLLAALGVLQAVEAHGRLSLILGNWARPFGIEFAVDRLSAGMILVSALIAFVCLVFQAARVDAAGRRSAVLPLVHGLMAGVGGAFATGDLFNLYVWFEVMLIAALGLLALRGRAAALDGTLRYLVLNMVGTLVLLTGIAVVYGATGQLNFAALAQAPMSPLLAAGVALLAVAFLAKAAAFPVFSWMPAAYHVLPAPVLALFAGLLSKVGIYALLRLFGQVFPAAMADWQTVLGAVAVATMLAGALGAAWHWDLRRILAFHIVSQIGYLILAVALATPAGYTAAIFYTIHHIVVKANLFLIAALVCRVAGSYDLRRIGGVAAARPLLAIVFAVPALSLVGIPPLSGFWSKFLVLRESFAGGHWVWGGVALATGVLTLYSMSKIWIEAFWKPHPAPVAVGRLPFAAMAAVALLAAITAGIGLFPQPLLGFAGQAAAGLVEVAR